jgi:DGQHR domain-containing protein
MTKIKAIKFKMSGSDYYLGLINAGDLVKNYEVDYWSKSNPKGYQRSLSKSRSKKFSDYLKNHEGILHQTILINIRNSKGISYKSSNGDFGLLETNEKFFLVDGQHRVGGIKMMIEQNPAFASVPIPVLIMVGLNREKEATQFIIVNKTQKGVRSDLADRLLNDAIKNVDKGLLEVIGIKEPQRITEIIVTICDNLDKDKKSIWYQRITFPNQKNRVTDTIKQRSMTESIKLILKDNYIQSHYTTIKQLTDLLVMYWEAINDLCPEACGDDAKEYVLLKTTGPFIMHKLLPIVIIKCGGNVTKTKIKNILSKIEQMEDNYWHKNGDLGTGSSAKFFNIWYEEFHQQII